MPGHGADHHSPFPGAASSCGAPGKSLKSVPVTGQTFRKGGSEFPEPARVAVLPASARPSQSRVVQRGPGAPAGSLDPQRHLDLSHPVALAGRAARGRQPRRRPERQSRAGRPSGVTAPAARVETAATMPQQHAGCGRMTRMRLGELHLGRLLCLQVFDPRHLEDGR